MREKTYRPTNSEEIEAQAFTVEQAAKYLQAHPNTIRKMIRAGRLPAAKVGREWRIHRKVLDEYLMGKGKDDRR